MTILYKTYIESDISMFASGDVNKISPLVLCNCAAHSAAEPTSLEILFWMLLPAFFLMGLAFICETLHICSYNKSNSLLVENYIQNIEEKQFIALNSYDKLNKRRLFLLRTSIFLYILSIIYIFLIWIFFLKITSSYL